MKYLIILFIGVVLSVNVFGQNDASKKVGIKRLFNDVKIALIKGDTVGAINKVNEVFTINPNDTNAYRRLGKIYGNVKSSFFNKKLALKYYNLFLQYSKNETNKEEVNAEIERLSQYEEWQNEREQSEGMFDTDVLNDTAFQAASTDSKLNSGNVETDHSEAVLYNSGYLRDIIGVKKDTVSSIQPQPVITGNIVYSGYLRDKYKDKDKISSNPDKWQSIKPVNPDDKIFKDTILTYLQIFDILKEDVKALKQAYCPKKDGTQYVSALFNHETGRDAIVLLFDDKGNLSLHKDCDLMVGFREIVKNERIDYNKQINVSSETSEDIWNVNIELNLPDSVLNNPSWGKNVYRMVGIYFNQSAEISPEQITYTDKICQNGKVLKISYEFNLEPINGILYGKSTICAEKTDGCKCVLGYSETNQLFGLANNEYKIKDANIEKIQKLNIDAESAQSAYEQYLKFCDFHQQTKNDNKNYTEYVNRINALASANQPEALFTSYLAHQYGLWKINKKIPSTKRLANQCKEKIISLQRFLKKNNW